MEQWIAGLMDWWIIGLLEQLRSINPAFSTAVVCSASNFIMSSRMAGSC
jgi:hypothetical protein